MIILPGMEKWVRLVKSGWVCIGGVRLQGTDLAGVSTVKDAPSFADLEKRGEYLWNNPMK